MKQETVATEIPELKRRSAARCTAEQGIIRTIRRSGTVVSTDTAKVGESEIFPVKVGRVPGEGQRAILLLAVELWFPRASVPVTSKAFASDSRALDYVDSRVKW